MMIDPAPKVNSSKKSEDILRAVMVDLQKNFNVKAHNPWALPGLFIGIIAASWASSAFGQIVDGKFVSGLISLALAAAAAYFSWLCFRKPQSKSVSSLAQPASRQNFELKQVVKIRGNVFRFILVFILGLVAIAVCLALIFHRNMYVNAGGVLVACLISAKLLQRILSGLVAFSFDGTGITIPRLFRSKSIPWSDIDGFTSRKITTYLYHVIPIAHHYEVDVKLRRGGKVKLPLQDAGLGADEVQNLLILMEHRRQSAVDGFSVRRVEPAVPPVPHANSARQEIVQALAQKPEPAVVVAAQVTPVFVPQTNSFGGGFKNTSLSSFGRRPSGFAAKIPEAD